MRKILAILSFAALSLGAPAFSFDQPSPQAAEMMRAHEQARTIANSSPDGDMTQADIQEAAQREQSLLIALEGEGWCFAGYARAYETGFMPCTRFRSLRALAVLDPDQMAMRTSLHSADLDFALSTPNEDLIVHLACRDDPQALFRIQGLSEAPDLSGEVHAVLRFGREIQHGQGLAVPDAQGVHFQTADPGLVMALARTLHLTHRQDAPASLQFSAPAGSAYMVFELSTDEPLGQDDPRTGQARQNFALMHAACRDLLHQD